MYAIVRSGGKQYRVEEKNILTVDKFEGEAGATATLGEVLYVGGDSPQWGKPTVAGATVTVTILEQARARRSTPSPSSPRRTSTSTGATASSSPASASSPSPSA